MDAKQPYPVRIEGELDANVSRWLWLVKWLLAIPHYIVLAFLWLTLLVLTVVAFFAILFTGRYPRGMFDFNVGVLRWTWRVAFYSYGALGTDRYPPFTLDDVPDYPARLDVAYPERLSRGLVLVKWWLLAIPHYSSSSGSSSEAEATRRRRSTKGHGAPASHVGLIGVLVFFAGVALLFTARYPTRDLRLRARARPVGRACGRLRASDAGRVPAVPSRPGWSGSCRRRRSRRRSAPPSPAEPAAPPTCGSGGRTVGGVVLIVVGVIAGIVALRPPRRRMRARRRRPDTARRRRLPHVTDRRTSRPRRTRSSPSAPTSTPAVPSGRSTRSSGTVRIRSESDRPVFLGIGPAAAVDGYLARVERDVVTDLDSGSDDPDYSRRGGAAPLRPPDAQTFWAASQTGAGEQTIQWEPEDGNWRAVVMNVDAARGVSADMSIGAELDSVLWIGLGARCRRGPPRGRGRARDHRRRPSPRGSRLTKRDGKAAPRTTSGQTQARCLRRAGFTRLRSRRS